MSIISSYTRGFKQSIKSPRMLLILYAVNLLSALILVLPFFQLFRNSSANTLEVNKLVDNFNFSYFVDLWYTSKDAFISLFSQIKWIVLLYWILNVFLIGGIIRVLSKEKFSISDFLSGASLNFARFLGSNLLIVFLQIILAAIIWIPFYIGIKILFDSIDNEKVIIILFFSFLILHALAAIVLMMINDYAKFHLILNNSKNIFKAVYASAKFVKSKFFSVYSLYLLLLIIPVVISYLYLKLSGDIGITTVIGLIFMFLIQQFYIFTKVWLKVWFYASQFNLFTSDFIKKERHKLNIDFIENIEDKLIEIKDKILNTDSETEEEAVG